MVSHRIYICDYTLIFHLCQAFIPNNLGLTIQDRYSIIKNMNKKHKKYSFPKHFFRFRHTIHFNNILLCIANLLSPTFACFN